MTVPTDVGHTMVKVMRWRSYHVSEDHSMKGFV